jgi:hypothetical protein
MENTPEEKVEALEPTSAANAAEETSAKTEAKPAETPKEEPKKEETKPEVIVKKNVALLIM